VKKAERSRAEKMFLQAKGKITNREIAKELKVYSLTVGRWKKEDRWADKLKSMKEAPPKTAKKTKVAVRKKVARDKALQIYMTAGGNITNKDLAKRAGASAATISKWKEMDRWEEQLMKGTIAKAAPGEEREVAIGELASPDQIVQINRRIDNLLSREHLTATEVAELALAKRDLHGAVLTYIDIVREVEKWKQAVDMSYPCLLREI